MSTARNTDKRVQLDFEIDFSNGGGIQGQGLRLDIPGDDISDDQLAAYIVRDMRLLMVGAVRILNKKIIVEQHERAAPTDATPQFFDLSHNVEDGMITYRGLPAPVICDYLSREQSRSQYADGTEFQIGKIEMVANTGTYLDSPFHRYPKRVRDLPRPCVRHRRPRCRLMQYRFRRCPSVARCRLPRTGCLRFKWERALPTNGPSLRPQAAIADEARGSSVTGFKSSWRVAAAADGGEIRVGRWIGRAQKIASVESGHVRLPEVDARPLLIVRAAAQGDAIDWVRFRSGPGLHVVKLQELLRIAAPATSRNVGAAAAVTLRDGAADRSGDIS